MRSFLAAVVMGLICACGGQSARANGLETDPVIGGIGVSCADFRGVPVRTTRMTELGDVARAWIVSRMPIIAVDTARMASLPDKMQLFFYFHECAHHVLAHTYSSTTSSENEADCWSVKSGRKRGLFTRQDVIEFAPVFAHSRGSPAGHLPGPQRAAHLLACFDDPSDQIDQTEGAQTTTTLRSSAGGG